MVHPSMGGCEGRSGLGTALPAAGEEGTAAGLNIAASAQRWTIWMPTARNVFTNTRALCSAR